MLMSATCPASAAVTQCLTFPNTNYNGAVLYFVYGVPNVGVCCDNCSRQVCTAPLGMPSSTPLA